MNVQRNLRILAIVLVLSLVASAATTTIPAGTRVNVRLGHSLSSETARSGDTFDANLVNDIVVGNSTIAKAGDPVKGKVTYAKASGRLKTPGQITIRLTSINGQSVATSSVARKGK